MTLTTYEQLPATAKVWIYQANQAISDKFIPEIRQHIQKFAANWASHANQLSAFGDIFHQQFIVLMVDESQMGASGCSIDTSVRFIKQLEQHYGLDLFDRMTFTYMDKEVVKTAPRAVFAALYEAGTINDQTLVFDNLVKNKGQFESEWLKPLGKSWHKRMV